MIKNKLRVKSERKNHEYRQMRPRKEYYGEMSQFDGSYHKWLNTEEEYCLLLEIDDATGKIMHAKIAENEGYRCVAEFWKERIIKEFIIKELVPNNKLQFLEAGINPILYNNFLKYKQEFQNTLSEEISGKNPKISIQGQKTVASYYNHDSYKHYHFITSKNSDGKTILLAWKSYSPFQEDRMENQFYNLQDAQEGIQKIKSYRHKIISL